MQGPFLAPETAGYAYAYSVPGGWRLVVNGSEAGTFERILDVGFVSNRTGIWFAVMKEGRAEIHYGTNVIDCGAELVRAMFEPDGSGYAAVYLDPTGNTVISVNGGVVDVFDQAAYNWDRQHGILEVAGTRQSSLYYRQYRM